MSDDSVYQQHIRDALADIAAYTGAGRDAFFAERMRQDATLRKLEIIGQAVKNLSDETRSREPHIPWKQIAGMRDKVIHDYFGVNLKIVWAVSRPKSRPTFLPLGRAPSGRRSGVLRPSHYWERRPSDRRSLTSRAFELPEAASADRANPVRPSSLFACRPF